MDNTKNKNRHNSLPNYDTTAKKIILTVIILATVSVIFCIVLKSFLNKEYIIKNKISSLAHSYYEDYYYPGIFNNKDRSPDILSNYTKTGLSEITLRQILLSDIATDSDTNILQQYCDEDSTLIKFFPDSPYNKFSYHTEYTYSCDF